MSNLRPTRHTANFTDYLESSFSEDEEDTPANCNSAYVNCLFCLSTSSTTSGSKVLENATPYGKDLEIRLDAPLKNREAFEILCHRLKIDWPRDTKHFNSEECLPLCFKCQNLYQEVYQLHVQIKQLEGLLEERVKLVEKVIVVKSRRGELGTTRRNLSWTNVFRKKVVRQNCRKSEHGAHGQRGSATETMVLVNPEGISQSKMEAESTVVSQIQVGAVKTEAFELNEDSHHSSSDFFPQQFLETDTGIDDELGEDLNFEEDASEPELGLNYSSDSDGWSPRSGRRNPSGGRSKTYSTRSRPCSRTLRRRNRDPNKPKRVFTLTCHICDATIKGSKFLQEHYLTEHPDEKKYTCKYCQKHFVELYACVRHQRTHTGEKPFVCPHCQKGFTSDSYMKVHVKMFHEQGDVEGVMPCSICGKKFWKQGHLRFHMETHQDLVFQCSICEEVFRTRVTCYKHNRKLHAGKAKCVLLQGEQAEAMKSRLKTAEGFECHECWQTIQGTGGAKLHFEQEHPNVDPLQCNICGKRYGTYSHCKSHRLRHFKEGKPLQCDQCPMRFFTNNELKLHTERHVPLELREKFTCAYCGAEFTNSKRFNHHVKVKHEEQRQGASHVCEICGKSYSSEKGYRQHRKVVHSTHKPFKCTHCEKTFAVKGDLTKHLRMHTKEKPFKCSYCSKEFSYNHGRTRHVSRVHGRNDRKKVRGVAPSKEETRQHSLIDVASGTLYAAPPTQQETMVTQGEQQDNKYFGLNLLEKF